MADVCCEYLNNRVWKNGRIITCSIWDGDTKYDVEESLEEQQRRISEWHQFLETDDWNIFFLYIKKIFFFHVCKIFLTLNATFL